MSDDRNGPPAVATAGRALKPNSYEQHKGTRHPPTSQHRSNLKLRQIAKTLRDDGYAGIRVRVLALNADRALAHGCRIDPADAKQLELAYRARRAEVRAGARAYRR